MRSIQRATELRTWSLAYRRAGLSVGFVPTLGGLHAGHVTLVRKARAECDRVVVSIYLNPTQFNSESDLGAYPARLDDDLGALRRERVDLVYLGQRDELLPAGFQSWVDVETLTQPLCGAFRPGHFRGVTTVVTQLLHVVRPHRAYFGLKDFQQVRVIQRMVGDLLFDVEMRLVDTVREPDGLAISSRNRRLSTEERAVAGIIFRALSETRSRVLAGETDVAVLEAGLRATLAEVPSLRVEYAEIRDGNTLAPVARGALSLATDGVVIAVAAHLGPVRLIDNVWIERKE